jgi:hypothetical protein
MRRQVLATTVLAIVLGTAATAAAQGQILIFNNNAPGVGFNDPTPAAPVGGNPGTTLGEQRQIVFLTAAAIWQEKLNPRVDIFVVAQFTPLGPNVLGSAGAITIWRDFDGAELPGTWYTSSLANHLAGIDHAPCGNPLVITCFDIVANFATTFNFYMGLDNNEGPGQQDLLAVILHELGHGLGFANFFNETTGQFVQGFPDIYSQYTFDVTTEKKWTAMTVPERIASAINVRKVSWDGINVNKAVPDVLAPGEPAVVVLSPAVLGAFAVGDAAFGPPLTSTGVTGEVVIGLDAADAASGPSPTDACGPIENDLTGKIALVDRGTCAFTIKVKNAQDAGAIGVLVADNAPGSPPAGMAGADPTITIPSVRISQADGTSLRNNLPATVKMTVDLSVLAGTDRIKGLMMLAAFNPVIGGSSISHFEPIAFPHQLMEPAINFSLTDAVDLPEDLTTSLFRDIGWFSDRDGVPDGADDCMGSDIRETVIIGTCDSGVDNVIFTTGCSITDLVGRCEIGARNHGAYVSCVSHVLNVLKGAGWISGSDKGKIESCAAKNK